MPYVLHDAIGLGLQFLSFLELPKEDRPKRSIWFNPARLEEHFKAVEKRHEERMSGKGAEIEDPVENDAARNLIVGE